jgi:hypothetical protein
MVFNARSGSYSCRTAISSSLRIALVVCLAAVAAAADIGMCSDSDGKQGTCPSTRDRDGDSYDILCRASLERIDELNQLALSDAAAFVPQAWAWIEAAGKCVYAIDNHIIAEPSPSTSSALQSHLFTFLRSVLSLDKTPLTPPSGACDKLLLAKKKKSLRKLFDATIPGGGLHPDLKIKVHAHHALSCITHATQRSRLFMPACSLACIGLRVERFHLRRRDNRQSYPDEGCVFLQRHTVRNGSCFRPVFSPPPPLSIQSIQNLALSRKDARAP